LIMTAAVVAVGCKFRWNRWKFTAIRHCGRAGAWPAQPLVATVLDDIPARPLFVVKQVRPRDAG